MTRYTVTKKAGKMLGGIRNPGAGNPVELTDSQAMHLLRTEQIRLPVKKAAKPASEKKAGK